MNPLTQKRLFITAIIVLVVLNIASLFTIWSVVQRGRGEGRFVNRLFQPNRNRENLKVMMAEELNLTDKQKDYFRNAGELYRYRSQLILRSYHQNKRAMFAELSRPITDTALIQRLTDSLGIRQSGLERLTAAYFLDLKGQCTPQQQKRFPELFQRLMRRMSLPDPRKEELPPPPPPPGTK